MKPRFWTSLLIFLSAYAPLALVVVAKDFDYSVLTLGHPVASYIAIAIALVSVALLWLLMRQLPGQHPVEIRTVRGRAGELINYSIPYLVTFVTVDKFFDLSNLIAFGLFMGLLFLLTLRTQSLFMNPILAIMGYGLFDVEFIEGPHHRECVLLTRIELAPGKLVRVLCLSQFLFLATDDTESKSKEA